MNISDLPTDNDLLPEGMTTEQSERVKALFVELRNIGLAVMISVCDPSGLTLQIAKGNRNLLEAMLGRLATQLRPDCTCSACQAMRAERIKVVN